MATTLRDIADELNISTAIVSRVLNDKPGNWASEGTKARIFDVARELNYRPSTSARALATGRSMQIAVAVDAARAGIDVQSADLRGFVESVSAHNYRAILQPLRAGEAGERELENLLNDNVCDGVCLYSPEVTVGQLRVLRRAARPCVILGDAGHAELKADIEAVAVRVDHDNYLYAQQSVQWLVAQGHRSIAWARSHGEGEQPHVLALLAGYRQAMEAHGLEPLILPWNEQLAHPIIWKERKVSAVMVRWLHGAIAWSQRAAENGLKLPADLTIMAHLDIATSGELVASGLSERLALHFFDSRRAGQVGGELLTNWATGQRPAESTVLVPTHAPIWGADYNVK